MRIACWTSMMKSCVLRIVGWIGQSPLRRGFVAFLDRNALIVAPVCVLLCVSLPQKVEVYCHTCGAHCSHDVAKDGVRHGIKSMGAVAPVFYRFPQ